MHELIMYAVAALLIVLSVIGLIVNALRNRYNNIVFPAQGTKALSLCSIFCALFLFALYKVAAEPGMDIIIAFSPIVLLCILAWIGMFNEVIIFDEEHFSVKNFIGVKRKYRYEEIQKMSIRTKRRRYRTFSIVCFYIGRKKVKSSSTLENHSDFVDTAAEKYKKTHNGQTIPLA